MNDVISVIVPVYNVEKYLERCLDSIINQTYKNLEIILIDDGSTDSSGLICDEFAKKDERIKVIHKVNEGSSSARNCGLDIARGLYIGFVDSDDYIELNMYEKMYEEISKNQADICICSRYIEYENGERASYVSKKAKAGLIDKNTAFGKAFAYSDFDMAMWDKLYKMELFSKVRFPVGKTQEDYYVTVALIEKAQKIFYLPIPFYHYIQRQGSITKKNELKMDGIIASKFLISFFQENHPDLVYIGKTAYVFAYIALINKCVIYKMDVSKELRNEAKDAFRNNLKDVWNNSYIPKTKKLQVLCCLISIRLYKIMIKKLP